MFHVPEDGGTAKPSGHTEVWAWLWKRGQEVTAAAPILPGDQLTGVFGSEEISIGPVTTCKDKDDYYTVVNLTQSVQMHQMDLELVPFALAG